MFKNAVVTGIPNYAANYIDRIDGLDISFQSSTRAPTSKRDVEVLTRAIGNTGNYFIGEGALDAITCPGVTFMPFWHFYNYLHDPKFYKEVNSKFDVFVFTAANIFRTDFSADMEAAVLDRITIPIVVIGGGIQRKSDLESDLSAGTIKFIRILAARNASVLTRGHETSAFLRSHGVKQARPTGCPSIYHFSDNVRRAWEKTSSARLSESSRMVFSGYLGNEAEDETLSDVQSLVGVGSKANYVLQDEFVHWNMELPGDDVSFARDPASGEMVEPIKYQHQAKAGSRLKLNIFFDPVQWRAWMTQFDFGLHRRFHGSIASLQAGVPSLMIAIDDRMREMLDFVGFPYIERRDWIHQSNKGEYLNSVLESLNVSEIVERYKSAEKAFRLGLRDAGLSS